MQFVRSFRKPEYVFRPSQVIRRLRREFRKARETEDVTLPCGLPIRVHPKETIGASLWRTGVHDICASECLWRLLDPGETALDIGANIGYMTGLMALRAGSNGRVIALEPHPDIFFALQENVSRWGQIIELARIDLLDCAASELTGRATLRMPPLFAKNQGVASLDIPCREAVQSCEVELTTLDDVLEAGTKVGALKLDVEGHELAVLGGAERLLGASAVRDIVFEEHGTPPTPVTKRLEKFGYEVFLLDATLWGPRIASIHAVHSRNQPHERDYLATIDPRRARERLSVWGWQILKGRKT